MRLMMLIATLVLLIAACSQPNAGEQTETLPGNQAGASTDTSAPPAAMISTQTALIPTAPESMLTPQTVPAPQATPTPENTALPSTSSLSIPDPARYSWEVLVSGLAAPVGITHAGDGSGRLFVVEKGGVIRILQGGELLPNPFLDITDEVGSQGSEQGLLGLAFHPDYRENGLFFVNYTDQEGNTVIARFNRSVDNTGQAEPQSETQLLYIPQPYANHNGGQVAFGPDGYLYLGLGDGGSGGDPQGNAQSTHTLLGKILRIDVNSGDLYTVPGDNPFTAGGGKAEIWAYGLRNPWRFSFDRQNGDLYIGDVGQNHWEEVNYIPAGTGGGANFGWDFLEATHPFEGVPPDSLELIQPVAEYNHDSGCSITAGFVYRGANLPEFNGVYLYGDYCSGNVWGLLQGAQGDWQDALLFENVGRIASFGEDEAGELYLVDLTGQVFILTQK